MKSCIVVLLFLFSFAFVSSLTEIDSCQTLGVADELYFLNQSISNHVGTCMVFAANNITLDLGGFVIDGDDVGTSDYGINTVGYDDLTVLNGTISDFHHGVYSPSGSLRTNYTNLISTSNTFNGIYILSSSNYNNFRNITVSSNAQYGLAISSSFHGVLDNIIASSSGSGGVYLLSGSVNNTITNLTAISNVYGYYIYSSTGNYLYNSTINSNTYAGVMVYSANNNYFENIDFDSNLNAVYIYLSSGNNFFDLNSTEGTNGVQLFTSTSNNFTGLTINGTSSQGIILNSSSNSNRFDNLNVTFSNDGVVLHDSSSNIFTDIISINNDYAGVYLFSNADSNEFTNLNCDNNTQRGLFLLEGSDFNIFQNLNSSGGDYAGIYLNESNSNSFSDLILNSNFRGLMVSYSDYNNFTDLVANSNSNMGVYLDGDSLSNLFTDIFTLSDYSGFFLSGAVNLTKIKNLYSTDNTYRSISDTTSSTNNFLIFNNTYGIIEMTDETYLNDLEIIDSLSWGNSTSNVQIGNFWAYINSTDLSELNVSANVTIDLTGSSLSEPVVMKDGVNCSDCYIFSYSSSEIKFNVSSFSNYSIVEGAVEASPSSEVVEEEPSSGSSPSASSNVVGTSGTTSSGEVTLSYGSKLEFNSDGVDYDVYLRNVDRTVGTATFDIVGDGDVILSVGESQELDVDGDGIVDVVVTLNAIDPDRVAVDMELSLIEDVSEVVVEDEVVIGDEEEVVPEETGAVGTFFNDIKNWIGGGTPGAVSPGGSASVDLGFDNVNDVIGQEITVNYEIVDMDDEILNSGIEVVYADSDFTGEIEIVIPEDLDEGNYTIKVEALAANGVKGFRRQALVVEEEPKLPIGPLVVIGILIVLIVVVLHNISRRGERDSFIAE